jgi:class 3 adenylate cyclase
MSPDELSTTSEHEYGGGVEVPATSFLVLGLLSFWTYTVFRYHDLLRRHVAARLAYFQGRLASDTLSPESLRVFDGLAAKGFACPSGPRNVSLGLYAASFALILSEIAGELLVLQGRLDIVSFERLVYLAVGAAAFLFCAASVHFMSWAARRMRDHEYHELLMARFVEDPAAFKAVAPSAKFTTRWSRNQNQVVLFLVLALPMIVSPVAAVHEIQRATRTGTDFGATFFGWTLLLFGFAGAFHLSGVRLLLGMLNGHLRVESVSREQMARPSAWVPERTQAVLNEAGAEVPAGGAGELLPRRVLATIMITDMVGYSREMQSSEEGTLLKLLRHNELVRGQIARHGGHEVKTMGDAFLVTFPGALDAVRAALDIQRALRAERIVIRIGIHTGEILTLDGDVLGNGVNIAARLEPLAEPGGICISADTYARVRNDLDVPVTSLGRRELKNIADAPELFRLQPADLS